MSIKKILVPTDFSPCAKNALNSAISLASKFEAELILMNAFQIPVSHGEFGAQTIITGLANDIEKDINTEMDKLIESLPALKKIKYKTSIVHSHTTSAIRNTIKKESIDLVIMGTHGASGIDEVLIGTNAYSTVKEGSCPVMVIPEEAKLEKIGRIIFASDYRHLNKLDSLKPLITLAKYYNSHIDVLHFSEELITDEERSEAKAINRTFKKLSHGYHFYLSADVEQSINDHIKKYPADLIVMIPRHHNFFERIFNKKWTKKMVSHSETPILTLPD